MRPQRPLPAGCSWGESRYAEARTSTSAVAAAVCDAEHEELRGLIAYCHERVDLLNSRDADFIVSMKRIVERYAVTPRQRRWALDIVHRLLLERTRDRRLRFTR